MDLMTLCDIIWFFAADPTSENWRSAHMSRRTVAETIPFIEKVAPVILNWPEGLYSWLDDNRRIDAKGSSLRANFGNLHLRVWSGLRGNAHELVRDQLSWYFAERWKGLLVGPNRLRRKSTESLTLTDAARALHIGHPRLRSMLKEGLVEVRLSRSGSRTIGRVGLEALATLRANLDNRHTLASVVRYLGISENMVKALMRRGLLRAEKLHSPHWSFPGDEPQRFIDELSEGASPHDIPGEARPISRIKGYYLSLHIIAEAVMRGEIQAWRRRGKQCSLDEILVLPNEVEAYFYRGMHTYKDAAAILEVSPEVIVELVKNKLLENSSRPGWRSSTKVIPSSAINEFRQQYVMTLSINIQGIESSAAKVKYVAKLGVAPVMPSASEAQPWAVWNRREVINALGALGEIHDYPPLR